MGKFSVLSWNIMGNTWYVADKLFVSGISRKRSYKKITRFLDQINPDIICLQEATQYLPHGLGLYLQNKGFAYINGNSTGFNIIASKLPFVNSGEIVLENTESVYTGKIPSYPSACLWVDCRVETSLVRIYNCQLRIRGVGISERISSLTRILEHAQAIDYPVIICGDMNTTIPKQGLARKVVRFVHNQPDNSTYVNDEHYSGDERFIFNSVAEKFAYRETLSLDTSTWALPYTSWELFKLKLDWFLFKNTEFEDYILGPYITDHRPIFVKLFLPQDE